MTRIAAVHPVLPPNVYDQAEITERFAAYCLGEPDGGVDRRPSTRSYDVCTPAHP